MLFSFFFFYLFCSCRLVVGESLSGGDLRGKRVGGGDGVGKGRN